MCGEGGEGSNFILINLFFEMKTTSEHLPIPGIQAELEVLSQAFSPSSWSQARHRQKTTSFSAFSSLPDSKSNLRIG